MSRKQVTMACVMAALVGTSGVAAAREVAGVTLEESTRAGGKELKLNGAGVRKKSLFKVYVAGLYLERPTASAEEAITSEQPKRMVLVMTRNVGHDQFAQAVVDGFQRNSAAQMSTLQPRLDRLTSMIPDLGEGDVVDIVYQPGVGTLVRGKGKEVALPGKDFADALFAVWLGQNPVDGDLKRDLVAR
jgi:hypothetical protein